MPTLNRLHLALALAALLLVTSLYGCFAIRRSSGGGRAEFDGSREIHADDIALPEGYRIKAVAAGFTFPTGVTFDADGRPCIVEAGYSYGEVWTTPRLLRIETDGRTTTIAEGQRNGPWTGVWFHDGDFYVAEGGQMDGGRILRISPDGSVRALVDSLPSLGDHHTNGPLVQNGWVYFLQGTATNSGVVGPDNARFGWLKRYPGFHDIPGQDITLSGENFESENPLAGGARAVTGPFLPYGTASEKGQVIPGAVKCNGAVLRVRPDGSNLELVAWGFRNPFGIAVSPDGKMYVTENGYDVRGSRPIFGAGDCLWEVKSGLWYGWPDYTAGLTVSDPDYDPEEGSAPKSLIADPPNVPPQPAAIFAVHSSSDGFDFSRSETFGFAGQAFVAQLGDEAPATGKVLAPVGFKIVRVDVTNGVIEDFAVNRGRRNGPASKIGGGGLERPVACRFTPSGNELYVVDFGVLLQSTEGAMPQERTGVLWRITRAEAERSSR